MFGIPIQKEERPLNYDFSLGYVIGVLVGDGSLSKWKDYHYFDGKNKQVPKAKATKIVPRFRHGFQLTVKDQDFAETFAQHLSRTTGKKVTMYPIQLKPVTNIAGNVLRKPYVFHGFKVKSISKEWYCRLKPLKEDLSWIKESFVEVKRGFLRGLFDSEGGYGSWGAVNLTNTNVPLLCLAKGLLSDFNISSTIYSNQKMPRLRIPKNNSFYFLDAIGFSIERKNKKIRELLESA